MPKIVEYESTSEITPSDKGIQAAEMAGRRIGQFYHQIGSEFKDVADKVEQHMSVMETSELYKTGTELRLNLQTRYEKESALPENRNDPHFGDRFMAEIGPLLDQWGSGAGTDHGKQLAATLKAQIRNEIFNHVAAGQAEMDSAHVQDNATQTMNQLGSGLITDPSEINLIKTLGTAKDAIQGMTMAIPDVATRENVASALTARYLPQLVSARYQGIAESIKNQIAETGGETSPALQQLNKDVAAQLGFQYLSPEVQARLSELGSTAVRQGQELFNSKEATARAKASEAGKEAYAEIHNAITNRALAGLPPTPEQVAAIQRYAQVYGKSNPGEAASLDDFLMRGQDRAISGKVQPYDQNIRDNIQAGMSLPKGDPRRPTQQSLLKAYSHGQITSDDLNMYTGMLDKLDKPETDPSFRPAWDAFVRWRNVQVQSIGNNWMPGTAVARAQFIHDATANFMGWGRSVGWDKGLDHITNPNAPGNLARPEFLKGYKDAAQKPNAAEWFKTNWHHFNENGTVSAPATGSTAAPVYPTSTTSAPAKAKPTIKGQGTSSVTVHLPPAKPVAPAADLRKADEIIWGKK